MNDAGVCACVGWKAGLLTSWGFLTRTGIREVCCELVVGEHVEEAEGEADGLVARGSVHVAGIGFGFLADDGVGEVGSGRACECVDGGGRERKDEPWKEVESSSTSTDMASSALRSLSSPTWLP